MNYLLDKIKICLFAKKGIVNLPDIAIMQIEQNSNLRLVEQYHSTRMMGYFENYLFKDDGEGTVFVGLRRNTYKEQSYGDKECCIEFNPQKVQIPLILKQWIGDLRLSYSSVLSCDVAIDFPYTLDQIRVQTKKRLMFVGNSNNLTRYIAPQEAHNRIKIYDKRQERLKVQKQAVLDVSPLTRVEITLKHPSFFESGFLSTSDMEYLTETQKALGEILVPRSMPLLRSSLEEKYGKFDPALCYLLENADSTTQLQALSLLSINARTKYKAWLSSGDYAPFDMDIWRFSQDVGRQILRCIYDATPLVNLMR